MFASSWSTKSYLRPIAYTSYHPRQQKVEVLSSQEPETIEVTNFLAQKGIKFTNLGGISRGIRFGDLEVGKRHFNHNGHNLSDEYFIHQWKPTNDRAK